MSTMYSRDCSAVAHMSVLGSKALGPKSGRNQGTGSPKCRSNTYPRYSSSTPVRCLSTPAGWFRSVSAADGCRTLRARRASTAGRRGRPAGIGEDRLSSLLRSSWNASCGGDDLICVWGGQVRSLVSSAPRRSGAQQADGVTVGTGEHAHPPPPGQADRVQPSAATELPGPRERGIDVVNLEIDDDPGVRAVGTGLAYPAGRLAAVVAHQRVGLVQNIYRPAEHLLVEASRSRGVGSGDVEPRVRMVVSGVRHEGPPGRSITFGRRGDSRRGAESSRERDSFADRRPRN